MNKSRNPWLVALGGCGCLVALILLVLVSGVGYLGFRGFKFGQQLSQAYGQVAVDYRSLSLQKPYSPPQDGLLEPERLTAFLSIRSAVAARLKEHEDRLKQAGTEVEQQFRKHSFWSVIRGLSKVKDIAYLAAMMLPEMARHHVALLKQHQMSAEEYQWLTRTYLGTLAHAKAHNDTAGAELWEAYLKQFEIARNAVRNVRFDSGSLRMHGEDMTSSRLVELLQQVEYHPQNAEQIIRLKDQLLPHPNVPLADFLGARILDITRQFESKQVGSKLALPPEPVKVER